MAKQRVPTDQIFSSEEAAWKEVMEHYSVEKNYIMRNAKRLVRRLLLVWSVSAVENSG